MYYVSIAYKHFTVNMAVDIAAGTIRSPMT